MFDIYRAEENAYFPVLGLKRAKWASGSIEDSRRFFPGNISQDAIVYTGRSFPIPEWFMVESPHMEAIAFFRVQGNEVRLLAMGVTKKVHQTLSIPPHLLVESD